MHIKQICISNFRSFHHQSELHPSFHEGTNTIVGRNGSGKSNLLDAVQFCLLSPRFANLRQEDRQALLHEGGGSAALTAFVELVLDNGDHRFSVEEDEVVIRRVIGLKKDELFLQRKRATKATIQGLLEGAGFSKSNPYFLVQQGRIQSLCLANDVERLQVLNEVAGTTVYDTKKQESLAQMDDNTDKVRKVNDILSRIEERLQELQREKGELDTYTALDKQRRGCECCLYEQEHARAHAQLAHLEEDRAQHAANLADLHEACRTTHAQIRHAEGVLHAKSAQGRHNARQVQLLEHDVKEGTQKKAQLQLECSALEQDAMAADEAQQVASQQLQVLQQEIHQTQTKLQTLTPQLHQAESELAQLQQERTRSAATLASLQDKQGRGHQFHSKEERDAYLTSTIAELDATTESKIHQLQGHRDSLASYRRSLQTLQHDAQTQQQQLQVKVAATTELQKALADKSRQRQSLQEHRKSDWRTVEQLREQVREARHEWQQCKGDSRKSMPKATAQGLQALETLVEQCRFTKDQVFGTVLDNIQLKQDKFATAVEVAAQNALFHVIVSDDEVASTLVGHLERQKLGRITFLPLNQLRPELDHAASSLPSNNTDVCSLLDACIQYDSAVKVAMQHVFGNKLLARSQQAASEWSAKCHVDAITLDGDLCSRKGAVSGGYVDSSKSRWLSHVKLERAKANLDQLTAQYQQANRKAEQADQQTTLLMQEVQKLEAKHAEVSNALRSVEVALDRLQARQDQQQRQHDALEKTTIPKLERDIENLRAERDRLQGEMATELTETLSDAEKRRWEELKQSVASLDSRIEAQNDRVAQLAAEHQKTTSLLLDNLLKRQEELTGVASNGPDEGEDDDDDNDDVEAAVDPLLSPRPAQGPRRHRRSSILGRPSFAAVQEQRRQDLRERRAQLDEVVHALEQVRDRLEEARKVESTLRAEVIEAKNELENLKSADEKNSKLLEEAQETSERLLNKRSMLVTKKETYSRKIQELGSLPPPSELEKFSGKSVNELMKSLEAINKQLKQFSHVNKKAFDQFVNFNDQRDSLLKRKEELDQGSLKIKELIESLDLKKDEAINRTFRGVSAHFKDVFSELVPSGAGELIMRTAIDDGEGGTDEEADVSDQDSPVKKKQDPNNPDVSLYRGVGIKVRFSEVGENYMMSQLSGGQKALVALALIFAIQRCDPAPFYIFDELDQALDSSYRAAVANLIERQANSKENPTQFIVTTFRPELVSVANRCYGISLQNKVSNLHHMKKRDALSFVASLLSEEEAVGDISVLPAARPSLAATSSARKRKDISMYDESSHDGTMAEEFVAMGTKTLGATMQGDGDDEVTSTEHDSP